MLITRTNFTGCAQCFLQIQMPVLANITSACRFITHKTNSLLKEFGSEMELGGKSVRSWCDGSLDRSFIVDPLSYFSFHWVIKGAGRSSEVERSLMVRWVVGSILHGVDPLSYFSFQPVLHDWCNKGRGMCYPVCGMVHIKEPLLLIDKSSLCGGSGFPFSLSEWSLTICLTPYNCR